MHYYYEQKGLTATVYKVVEDEADILMCIKCKKGENPLSVAVSEAYKAMMACAAYGAKTNIAEDVYFYLMDLKYENYPVEE